VSTAPLYAEVLAQVFEAREFPVPLRLTKDDVQAKASYLQSAVFGRAREQNETILSPERRARLVALLPRIRRECGRNAFVAWSLYQAGEKEAAAALLTELFGETYRFAKTETIGASHSMSLIATNELLLKMLERVAAPSVVSRLRTQLAEMKSIPRPPN
jgi:hypothetical protein